MNSQPRSGTEAPVGFSTEDAHEESSIVSSTAVATAVRSGRERNVFVITYKDKHIMEIDDD